MGEVQEIFLPIEPFQQSPRKVYIYLPSSYKTSNKKYPVLYMFDGHNLFDDESATYGTSWRMKDYLDEQELDLVVVGVDCNHEGKQRLEEYCPLHVDSSSWIAPLNARGKAMANWMAHDLKPYIEEHYRVKTKRKDVGIGGSSMGGLMAIYMIAYYNHLYSKAACVSSTLDIDFDQLVKLLEAKPLHKDTRIYLDFGSEEVKRKKTFAQCLDRMLMVNHIFTENGATTFPNLVVGGQHSEETWQHLTSLFLPFLFQDLYQ